jgi:hypothetical protein
VEHLWLVGNKASFSCLTRRNHKTISSLISYRSQLRTSDSQSAIATTRTNIVLNQLADPVSDRRT